MNRKLMTEYERATLRLEAWKALEGWGTRNASGDYKTWDMKERKEKAAELAEWAASE